MDVLIEKEIKDKPDFYEGYTRNYIKVNSTGCIVS